MQSAQFINIIQKPELIQAEDAVRLNELSNDYPYCASLYKLRLKALKKGNSKEYNQALKLTASISANRSLLFDYITQADKFTPLKELIEEIQSPEETLNLGQPLEFDTKETHSFSEWLKLSQLKPINRNAEEDPTPDSEQLKPLEKTTKIVDFIANNAKKKRPKKEFFSPNQMARESLVENNSLMTETLAKVYLEQGHYEKAITAYEILSLKYPQKSGLFADQIKAIKKLNP